MTMATRPWYMNYPSDVVQELLRTRPEFKSLVPQSYQVGDISGTPVASGPMDTGSMPASINPGNPAATGVVAPERARWTQKGDLVFDNQTGIGYSTLTAPPEAKAALGLTTPTPTGSGAQAGFYGGPAMAPGGGGGPAVSDLAPAPGAPSAPSGTPSGTPSVAVVPQPNPNGGNWGGGWGSNPTSGLPAGMDKAKVWWGLPADMPPDQRMPTWQEKDAKMRETGPGIPAAITNPITGVQRGTPFLGTNLPRFSNQALARMLPSERALLATTVNQTGGRAEDFFAQSAKLSGSPTTSGYSVSGAPRAGRR